MKIAISVPDPIYRQAERAARRMRVPRSQFYARAVAAYLAQSAQADVTARLDAVYADEAGQSDEFLDAAARSTMLRNE